MSFVDDGISEDAFRKLDVQPVREGFVDSFELVMEISKLGDSDESLSSEAPSSKELVVPWDRLHEPSSDAEDLSGGDDAYESVAMPVEELSETHPVGVLP